MTIRRKGAENMANRSGLSLARLLGVTSPKTSTTTVATAVATVAPPSPIRWMNSSVQREERAMLTMLLPMRMEVSILSYCSDREQAKVALLSPFSARTRRRVRFREEKAVSVAEK